ncbi:MAG TPA: PilZ domain-containing protein [Kofleriaceae bacterium]|nr:PilZ domain-containing protein [Kofleriaceae bacterium]
MTARPKVVVSNNSELLRHLSAAALRRLDLDVTVEQSGDAVVATARALGAGLVIVDAELAVISGYEVARELAGTARVVLILGHRLSAEKMRRVAESGCAEVLVVPMTADQLYDVIAIQLGLPRRGSEHLAIDLTVEEAGNERRLDGRISNLSIDGARLVVSEPIPDGAALWLTVTPAGGDPLRISARAVWTQPQAEGTVVGAEFSGVDPETRARLSQLLQWEIVEETERKRVVIKGDITEATSFSDLLPELVGRVDFDLSQVSYMNSLGVRAWCEFLRDAPIQGYELNACSVAFVLQAAMVKSVVGRGTITSFFAPYHCDDCDFEEERLLQSAAILATEDREPPAFACPECGGALAFDDIPDRYLAFLRDSDPI